MRGQDPKGYEGRFNRDDSAPRNDAYRAFTKDSRYRSADKPEDSGTDAGKAREESGRRPHRDWESREGERRRESRPADAEKRVGYQPDRRAAEGHRDFKDKPARNDGGDGSYRSRSSEGGFSQGHRPYRPGYDRNSTPKFTAKETDGETSREDRYRQRSGFSGNYSKNERRSFNPNFDRDNRPRFSNDESDGESRQEGGMRSGGRNGQRSGFSGSFSKNERRSFNPNFDRDNRPRFTNEESDNRSANGRRAYENGNDHFTRGSYDRIGGRDGSSRQRSYDRKPFRSIDRPRTEGTEQKASDFRVFTNIREPQQKESDGRKQGFRPKDSFTGKGEDVRGNRSGRTAGSKEEGQYPTFPAAETSEEGVRLNRYIAMSGICSRREADGLIADGLVSVNGQTVSAMGYKVMPGDVVSYNGKTVENEKKVYILMNKPKGYVTTMDDPHADKTVMDLLKGACRERIYPVGRLDRSSVGVLLFTNDGDLAKKLTHPTYEKKKVYQVTLDTNLSEADMTRIAEGITLEDGEIHADEISYVDGKKNEIGIEIHSGRNRIVRRIFDSLGYKVTKLDRVYFAGLTKYKLPRGEWRFLTREEVAMLKKGSYE